ncbi:MAG TPA: alpha/beta fold hydrolase [Candidatus Polarisedimenticolaceae bacterium]|nr:alpha/beta fold hydrolase [Candidatus Polarisedimenticolaceae bacterium]
MSGLVLPCVEVQPPGPARAAVLFLHGLGADGHDFEPVVPLLGLPPGHGVRFVFPHAPSRPVTVNGGMVMPAWYDIRGLDLGQNPDAHGIESSSRLIRTLLEREVERGIPAERIVLGGFSQGGAMALQVGLTHRERLAGLLGLSCYLPLPDRVRGEEAQANRSTPIFMGHGTDDDIVPVERGEASQTFLRQAGYPVEWKTYPMAHQVDAQEIVDVGEWIGERLLES